MSSACAGCPEHEIFEVKYSRLLQGVVQRHRCKVTGKELYPHTNPVKHCIHKKTTPS